MRCHWPGCFSARGSWRADWRRHLLGLRLLWRSEAGRRLACARHVEGWVSHTATLLLRWDETRRHAVDRGMTKAILHAHRWPSMLRRIHRHRTPLTHMHLLVHLALETWETHGWHKMLLWMWHAWWGLNRLMQIRRRRLHWLLRLRRIGLLIASLLQDRLWLCCLRLACAGTIR